jgi:hypothetical protein
MALPNCNSCCSVWRTTVPKPLPCPRHWRPPAAHAPLGGVVERVGLRLHRGRLRGTGRRDGRDEVEDFFCAL